MGVFPKLTLDIMNKSLKTLEILTEKDFKAKLNNKSSFFMAALMLSIYKADKTTKR